MTVDEQIPTLAAEWRRVGAEMAADTGRRETEEGFLARMTATQDAIADRIATLRPITAAGALRQLELAREEGWNARGEEAMQEAALSVLSGLLLKAA